VATEGTGAATPEKLLEVGSRRHPITANDECPVRASAAQSVRFIRRAELPKTRQALVVPTALASFDNYHDLGGQRFRVHAPETFSDRRIA